MSVQALIEKCAANKEETLDLSGKQLSTIPDEVVDLVHLRELNIDNNKIKVLTSKLPSGLETLSASNNEITELKWGDIIPSILRLNLSNNYLQSTSLHSFPSTIVDLDISHNRIRSIDLLSSMMNLTRLVAHDNNITTIPMNLSSKLVYMDVSCNMISHVTTLPFNIEVLDISNNRLEHIRYMPTHLKILRAYKNELRSVQGLSSSTKIVDLSLNKLVEYPKGLTEAISVDVSNNQIVSIPKLLLADTLKEFDCSYNKLKKIPDLSYIETCNTKGNEELIEDNGSDTSSETIDMEDFWKNEEKGTDGDVTGKSTALVLHSSAKKDEGESPESKTTDEKFPGKGHKLTDLTSKTVNYASAPTPPPYKAVAKVWNPHTMQWEEKESTSSTTYSTHNVGGYHSTGGYYSGGVYHHNGFNNGFHRGGSGKPLFGYRSRASKTNPHYIVNKKRVVV